LGKGLPNSPLITVAHSLKSSYGVRIDVMRRYLGSLAFAGCAAIATPLVAAPASAGNDTAIAAGAAVAVQQVRVPVHGLRDEAAMVLVGTALIGLAAAVRRAA
jgi:nitrous oxide reductase